MVEKVLLKIIIRPREYLDTCGKGLDMFIMCLHPVNNLELPYLANFFIKTCLKSESSKKLKYMGKILNLKNRKRKTTHGFLVRNKTSNGKRVIKNRRRKGRSKLSV